MTLADFQAEILALEKENFTALLRREDAIVRTIEAPTAPPELLVDLGAGVAAVAKPSVRSTSCHAGVRAPRYARNSADLDAHPELFRCGACGMLLDSPEWERS